MVKGQLGSEGVVRFYPTVYPNLAGQKGGEYICLGPAQTLTVWSVEAVATYFSSGDLTMAVMLPWCSCRWAMRMPGMGHSKVPRIAYLAERTAPPLLQGPYV